MPKPKPKLNLDFSMNKEYKRHHPDHLDDEADCPLGSGIYLNNPKRLEIGRLELTCKGLGKDNAMHRYYGIDDSCSEFININNITSQQQDGLCEDGYNAAYNTYCYLATKAMESNDRDFVADCPINVN
jgi:hypothetical protein